MGRIVNTDDLEKGLRSLMDRNGVMSFYSTAFDAIDFESLIDEAPTVEMCCPNCGTKIEGEEE